MIKTRLIGGCILIIVLILGIKIYFEINNYFYQANLEKIKKNNELNIQIESLIEHKQLKQDGYEINYYVSWKGNSDLIIFLHPAFSDHRAFNQQIDFFSKKYKVITIDLIGHGLSDINRSKDKIDTSAKHISEILEIEKIKSAHIVGVSMGALIWQYFALKYPEKTKSLIAIGGYNINEENKEVEKSQRSSNIDLIFRAIFSMKSFREKVAKISTNTQQWQILFYESTSLYKRKSFRVMQGLQNIIKNRLFFKPQYPTLILVGEFDIELASKMGQERHKQLENSEYHLIKNAGHCANIDKPKEFNKIVMDFITQNLGKNRI